MGEIKEQEIGTGNDRYRGKCYRGSDTVSDIISCKKPKKNQVPLKSMPPFFVKQYDYGFSKSNF